MNSELLNVNERLHMGVADGERMERLRDVCVESGAKIIFTDIEVDSVIYYKHCNTIYIGNIASPNTLRMAIEIINM